MPETLLFFRELFSRPRQVSAIAPSSRFLARAMAADLRPGMRVVEFGPGTGRLTEGILTAGVKPADLTLFEMSADFTTHLRAAFPGVTLHNTGAQNAPTHVAGKVDAVVSGLPLLSMPLEVREASSAPLSISSAPRPSTSSSPTAPARRSATTRSRSLA